MLGPLHGGTRVQGQAGSSAVVSQAHEPIGAIDNRQAEVPLVPVGHGERVLYEQRHQRESHAGSLGPTRAMGPALVRSSALSGAAAYGAWTSTASVLGSAPAPGAAEGEAAHGEEHGRDGQLLRQLPAGAGEGRRRHAAPGERGAEDSRGGLDRRKRTPGELQALHLDGSALSRHRRRLGRAQDGRAGHGHRGRAAHSRRAARGSGGHLLTTHAACGLLVAGRGLLTRGLLVAGRGLLATGLLLAGRGLLATGLLVAGRGLLATGLLVAGRGLLA